MNMMTARGSRVYWPIVCTFLLDTISLVGLVRAAINQSWELPRQAVSRRFYYRPCISRATVTSAVSDTGEFINLNHYNCLLLVRIGASWSAGRRRLRRDELKRISKSAFVGVDHQRRRSKCRRGIPAERPVARRYHLVQRSHKATTITVHRLVADVTLVPPIDRWYR